MKILIGVDDSPHSRAAVDYVRRVAWPKGTEVIVLSAVRPAVYAYSEIYVPAQPLQEGMEALFQIHQEIASVAEQSLRQVGLATQAKVLEGDPRIAIVEMAAAEHADLIVVGSHGRTGLAKLIMGSVASHVVTHAPCSVLVVRPHER